MKIHILSPLNCDFDLSIITFRKKLCSSLVVINNYVCYDYLFSQIENSIDLAIQIFLKGSVTFFVLLYYIIYFKMREHVNYQNYAFN